SSSCSPLLSSLPLPPPSSVFPYTTLFRSSGPWSPPRRRPAFFKISRSSRKTLFSRRRRLSSALSSLSSPGRAPLAMSERFTHSRSEEHTSELQSRENLVCRLLLAKKKLYY